MDCLLLVSGPSGCGKTSFVRSLYRRELSREISDLLPECLTKALSVDAKYPDRPLKGSMADRNGHPILPEDVIAAAPKSQNCIIFHNALNRFTDNNILSFSEDAALLTFLNRNPKKIIVIDIKVTRGQLVKFYTRRSFGREGVGLLKLMLAAASMSFGKVRTAIKYGYTGFAWQLDSRWRQIQNELLASVKERRPETQFILLEITPVTDNKGVNGFRLERVEVIDGLDPSVF